jgi:hypothetical protein
MKKSVLKNVLKNVLKECIASITHYRKATLFFILLQETMKTIKIKLFYFYITYPMQGATRDLWETGKN